jgi:hypothetical protein
VLKAFEVLDTKGQEALNADIMALIDRFNVSGTPSVVAPAEYIESGDRQTLTYRLKPVADSEGRRRGCRSMRRSILAGIESIRHTLCG